MGKAPFIFERSPAVALVSSTAGLIALFFLANWLRVVTLEPDPVLQGYLQITCALLAFVFAAVALVRFQGTRDRIALILGSGFLLSGAILAASSLLFFEFSEAHVQVRWAILVHTFRVRLA